jgi:hypothetical protein
MAEADPIGLRLWARARRLRSEADQQAEAVLLQAAVWLELRPDAHACPQIAESIALHYLLLAEHPEVRRQPGLGERYTQRAWTWAHEAEHGVPTLCGLLERARPDA